MAASESVLHDHLLPGADFLALTGGKGDAAAVRRFAGTERSWRMIALRHLMSSLEPDEAPGPLDPVQDAWDLMLTAETADEATATEIIMYPQAGIWIAHMLRRLHGVVTDEWPLWMDTGYLHTLAATAAIRAGVDFTLTVPVRSGTVVLPSLGTATLSGTDVAEVRRAGNTVTVSSAGQSVRLEDGDPSWRPAPRCVAEVDGARIEFLVDDVDPYRDLRGYSAPSPLRPDELDRWQRLTNDAWTILVGQDRVRAEATAEALTTLIPLPAAKPWRPLSASCDEAYAAVVASMPEDAEQFAVTLVHETQHVKLGALLHLVTFVDDPSGPLVYAPWRDDPRPLSGALQGIYAFVGITDFWRRRPDQVAAFEFALWRMQLGRVLTDLVGDPRLSSAGHELIANLLSTVTGWSDHPVETEVLRAATAAAVDHRAQWRALHTPAPADWVGEARRALEAGKACPPVDPAARIAPITDTSARLLDGRAVLIRVRLADRQHFGVLAKNPAEIGHHVPGTQPADVALVAGDASAAVEGYRRALSQDPADARSWAGLGLALAASGRPARLLTERPELIRALARESSAVDPLELVAWMEDTRPLADGVIVSTIS